MEKLLENIQKKKNYNRKQKIEKLYILALKDFQNFSIPTKFIILKQKNIQYTTKIWH